jgi:predicted kinase
MGNSRLTLVMMAGLPGAGKTTIADALGRELGWKVVDKDGYRVVLLGQGMDDELAATTAYEYSFKEIRTALMEQHKSVIFDSAALHSFIPKTLREIADSAAGVQLKVILCIADRELRQKRLSIRRQQHTRIRAEAETIADYLRYFEHLPEDQIVLHTNVPPEECLALAKAYVIDRSSESSNEFKANGRGYEH